MPSETCMEGADRGVPTSGRRRRLRRLKRSTGKRGISLEEITDSLVPIRIPPATQILVRRASLEDIFFVVEVLFLNTYRELTIRRGDCVADLGANIGTFGVLAGRTAGQVVCVEREPAIFPLLKENLNRSLGRRGICVQATISDSSFEDERVSVDDLARRLGLKFDSMKIDIEGDEVKALEGSEMTLKALRELIMEVHSPSLLREVTSHLETAGFRVHLLEGAVGKLRKCRNARSYKLARLSMYLRPLLHFSIANVWVLPRLAVTALRALLRHFLGPEAQRDQRDVYLIHAVKEGQDRTTDKASPPTPT